MTLSNFLSWSRILAAVVLPIIFYFSQPAYPEGFTVSGTARALFVFLIFLTDWLDGRIARKRNQKTDYGAWLDQFSDKVLVSSLSLYFWLVEPALPVVFVFLLLVREWGIALLRSKIKVPVRNLGKYKVWVQGMAFAVLAASFYVLGSLVYFAALVLAYWSAYYYVKQALIKTT